MFRINMEMCDQITRIYERQAEGCAGAVQRVYARIEDIGARTGYMPIVSFGNQIASFYKNDLRRHLMRQYQEWYDGGYSFHALMRAINAGDDAIGEARRKMDRMGDYLNEMFAVPMQEQSLNGLAEPNIVDADFEEFRDALQSSVQTFDTARGEAKSAVNAMGSENDVVLLIGDIVETTGVSLERTFLEFIRQVLAGQEFTNEQRTLVLSRLTGGGNSLETRGTISWPKGYSRFR